MESELERLRKERIALEKKIEEKSLIDAEKRKIKTLQREEKSSSGLFHKLKDISAEMEMSMHPERFNKDGSRKKGKAGMREWEK